MALLVYFFIAVAVMVRERQVLMDAVTEMERVHRLEERQVQLNFMQRHAIETANENYFAPDLVNAGQVMALEIEAILPSLRKQMEAFPQLEPHALQLAEIGARLLEQPARSAIAEARMVLHRLTFEFDQATNQLRQQKLALLAAYRNNHDRVTLELFLFIVVGLSIFGGLAYLFFRRLSADIDLVRRRAIDIVRGYRGEPLMITRSDEMGALMEAINVMQHELRERETQIELIRQQQFHKEKMAAVGSLAAAVAHEINNPPSAIVGIAESMLDEAQRRRCAQNGALCKPDLILDQARRVMTITRQISEFSVPQSPEPELIDLNGLVRSTIGFVSFDRRFRRIEITQHLDPDLPAVLVVADHLVQVLMNLLINAADAIQERDPPSPRIDVRTLREAEQVQMVVSDNGVGIAPENLEKVFAEHFTTKPPGSGAGLGLALCRKLIRDAGGDIRLESTVGVGTRAIVSLPVPALLDHEGI